MEMLETYKDLKITYEDGPDNLLDLCKIVETKLGRKKSPKNAAKYYHLYYLRTVWKVNPI